MLKNYYSCTESEVNHKHQFQTSDYEESILSECSGLATCLQINQSINQPIIGKASVNTRRKMVNEDL